MSALSPQDPATLNYETPPKTGMFRTPDGKNVVVTFILVSSLFLLWGFLNGMIDVMDKHFQEELHLTLAQSATVQFAHYLGYFLMALPAGWLATKLGYKGGIIAGLLLVAVGGIWFIPATKIAQFWAFLVGVCLIASGLTFLETIANPYTTVLGDRQSAATRINLAQSCNGVGWIFGPIVGGMFFYGKDAAGKSTGSATLYIPYAACAAIVVVLAIVFAFANVPDIKTEEDLEEEKKPVPPATHPKAPGTVLDYESPSKAREINRPMIYFFLLANAVTLTFIVGEIISTFIALSVGLSDQVSKMILIAECSVSAVMFAALIPVTKNITHQSVWSHSHFSGATLAQFFYVAAQAGIFSFLINYMTSQTPAIPASWADGFLKSWFDVKPDKTLAFSNQGAANLASLGFFCFLAGRGSGAALLKKFSAHKVLGLYGLLNVAMCAVVFLKIGWLSVACVFLSYFFMSIMFPTIFALGIFGLGKKSKTASAFIVMAIMGGAVLPKRMGAVADAHDMSKAFIVPLACFALVALYGYLWPKLSGQESMTGVKTSGGH